MHGIYYVSFCFSCTHLQVETELGSKLKGRKPGKLHFTTLNYTLDHTLHHKLFKYTLCIINYHTYYTLHPTITFQRPKTPFLKNIKNKCLFIYLFSSLLSRVRAGTQAQQISKPPPETS